MMVSMLFATLSCLGMLLGHASRDPSPEPRFSELSSQDRERLEQQRALIASTVKQWYSVPALTRTKSDLTILQRLLDDQVFKKTQTYELQSLGVVFGDVLVSELPLRWVTITDEFGTDPTLRFKNSSININALTMISKRVERGEHVDLQWLLDKARESLSEAEKQFR